MKRKGWAVVALAAAAFLIGGCKGFWDLPADSSFTLTNSGNITVSPGSSNTATITVTPSSSFSGTVSLTCEVTTSPSSATSPTTCSLSPTSVSISGTTAETSTLTATTTSTTSTGNYQITVTGVSGSVTESTTVCVGVGTSSSGCSAAGSSGNFYVLNVATNEIAGYYVNAGSLTALSGSPYTVPTTALSMAISPNNSFLYVGTASGIYVYTIASNGQLALANSSAPITSDQAISMQVTTDGNWLIEVASGAPYVYAIPINSSTGVNTSRTEQYAVLPVSTVQQVAVAPDESYVIAAMGSGGTATIPFTAGNTNPLGAVGKIALKNSAGAALSVAVDPSSRLFYVGETAAASGSNTGGLRVFNLSTLTEISGSPFATKGLAPYSILPVTSGDYVYVVNRQVSGSSTGVIAGYSIAASNSTYTLTALGSTFTAGTNPEGLAEDNQGNYVFAVNYGGSPDLRGYTFDSTNAGYLDAVISEATGTDPVQASAIVAAH